MASDEIRAYAMGKQDVAKYKSLIEQGSKNDYIKIDWFPQSNKILRHFKIRVFKKFRQVIKNYCMIKRLKTIKR